MWVNSTGHILIPPTSQIFIRYTEFRFCLKAMILDWLITNILLWVQITQSNDTVLLGLIFLKTISEEWPNVKDELSTARSQELKSLLIQEVPKIFQLLHRKFVNLWFIFSESWINFI
jgi:hypothetical protein